MVMVVAMMIAVATIAVFTDGVVVRSQDEIARVLEFSGVEANEIERVLEFSGTGKNQITWELEFSGLGTKQIACELELSGAESKQAAWELGYGKAEIEKRVNLKVDGIDKVVSKQISLGIKKLRGGVKTNEIECQSTWSNMPESVRHLRYSSHTIPLLLLECF